MKLKKILLLGMLAMQPSWMLATTFSVTVPEGAFLEIGTKSKHFVDFEKVAPTSETQQNGKVTFTFDLTASKVYNYRTWMEGGVTNAGYFTMNADASKCPILNFSHDDYFAKSAKTINHDPQSNGGYETGDIFVNINPQGFLNLAVGESFDAHAMRTWELSDNAVNNYFIEPDFHYTVLNLDGTPSSDIINIEETPGSPWTKITGIKKGTVIVMVTYDAINLNYYSGSEKKDYLGGSFWGAIWPENTAVYVVAVGEEKSIAEPNFVVNEKYNAETLKLAGKYIDAEHDVFYYLDSEPGYVLNFTPSGVVNVEIAYPLIGEETVAYSGFSTEGVTPNSDGSYSLLLKKGRQIVKLTDAGGNATYQVLTAKECGREIINATRDGSRVFQPGDKIKIQYTGLFHPANKIAGIYNMSAYVTYNGKPNGSSLIQSSNQYNFGSASEAQAVTVELPSTMEVKNGGENLVMNEGVIQVNGYGDPIGNHRTVEKDNGRAPNMNAVSHKTYFGSIPDVNIFITPIRNFNISLDNVPANAEVKVSFEGNELSAGEGGRYSGTYGAYTVSATADGYKNFRTTYYIDDDAEEEVVFTLNMEDLDGAWDGKSIKEPVKNDEGFYVIEIPEELAWFARHVNDKATDQDAMLAADLHLGNFDWSPIGSSASAPYKGTFEGHGHKVEGIYINAKNYVGLFGYANGATIKGVTVDGEISGAQYVAGVVGYAVGASTIDQCANYAKVTGTKTYVGGIVGYLYAATSRLSNSYNSGEVTGTTKCGGLIGDHNKSAAISKIFNVGKVSGTTVGACVGGTTGKDNVKEAYALKAYGVDDHSVIVSEGAMESGEIAFKLGAPFMQTIGEDMHPVFNGLEVYRDDADGSYYNIASALSINAGNGDDGVETSESGVFMTLNKTYSLDVDPYPAAARLPQLVWSSSDERIVAVDGNGLLTAKGEGTADIKVSHASNPDMYDVCKVYVSTSTRISDIFGEGNTERLDVYDINGCVILQKASGVELRRLNPGLYIFRRGREEKKVLVR